MAIEAWTVEIPVIFTTDDIDNIMVGAIEGGINYWAESIEDDDPELVLGEANSMRVSRLLQEGKEIRIIEDVGESHVLTMDKLLNGIKLNHIQRPNSDPENYDAEDYDCIVQLAIFDSIVYG